jgi:hypothetical protein
MNNTRKKMEVEEILGDVDPNQVEGHLHNTLEAPRNNLHFPRS